MACVRPNHMRHLRMRALPWLAVCLCALSVPAQTTQSGASGYTLQLPVDEVVLTFHATDAHGLPVNDIRAGEIRLLDNGVAPSRIVSFAALLDRPLRVALLLDTSESMARALAQARTISKQFAARILRPGDQGLLTQFGYTSVIVQPWTADASMLIKNIGGIYDGQANPLPGTALIDSIFRTCHYGFATADSNTGNFILLFSDGEDTASRTSMDEALRACQRSNTAIYAFRVPPTGMGSPGPRTLAELTEKTGGRVFPADETEDAVWNDLRVIESEMRNQYRVVYRPAHFVHNGAFHSIELQLPDRVSRVEVRSGYFAPNR